MDMLTIHQRMVAVLEELPAIGKNQKNEQQNFMFRGHDDVLNALNPLLAKHGVFVVPDVVERVTTQRTTSKGSVMFEVSLHVRFTFYGKTGDSITGSTWGEGTDMGDKATSKAMTMAFKSMLNQAFAISNAETADPDRGTPDPSQGSNGSGSPPAGAQRPVAAAVETPVTSPAAAFTPPEPHANGTPEFTFASGKHEGKTIAEVPSSYLDWYVANGPRDDVKAAIAAHRGNPVSTDFAAGYTLDDVGSDISVCPDGLGG